MREGAYGIVQRPYCRMPISASERGSSVTTRSPTRIVAIGASAGGLAALEQFFAQVPAQSGLAYVVVQHLDPTEKSLLSELLQRVTSLRVREAGARQRIEPDCVYVIEPNRELSVVGGVLKSEEPDEPRGLRLPINLLFSSLARDQGDRAIAVILSGMGSDGTLGLASIKTLGGLVLVQQPDSAQFDSMPRSVIDAGLADIVALPAELPARIMACIAQSAGAQASTSPALAANADNLLPTEPLHTIVELLLRRTKHDFSLYKPSTLLRRMDRRMAIHAIPSLSGYAEFLRENSQELDLLFKELLIGVTSFFRDAAAWQHLADSSLPDLLSRRPPGQKIRAWVVGCSTGEEAYSLAMVFAEVLDRFPQHRECGIQIFATDLSPDAISIARRGRYPASIATGLSAQRLVRFFDEQDGQYRVGKSIRDCVLFAQHDVILDPPFTRLDVLCCRNLMIYFDAALQRRLLPLFHYTLQPGGMMLLGSSETVGRFNQLFTPIDAKLRIYQRLDESGGGDHFLAKPFPPLTKMKKELPVSAPAVATPQLDSLQMAADQLLLQVHAPPAVVVNKTGDIVYISGHTGKYLEPAAGKANLNFHAMVREGLRAPIAGALDQALVQGDPIHLRGLQVPGSQGLQRVDVTVHALQDPAALKGMVMVVFRDVTPLAGRTRRKAHSEAEASQVEALQQYRDEIQLLREETRASKEELQSANEELQSTNEELQSTNEELTSSKEEMQSMNEELQTINAEMQTKLDDLALAQSDLRNLLNSTDIAMLFLDKDLNVRRYTDRASKIINLRESDIGRPLSDLTTSLQYASLQADVQETLRTLMFSEKQILTSDSRWFSVRIMPYRRLDNVIDGAVITFVDITAVKELEAQLRSESKQ